MYDIYYTIGGVLLVLLVNSLIVMPIVVFFLGRSVSKLKKQVSGLIDVNNQYRVATKTKDLITGLNSQLADEKLIKAPIQANPTNLVASVDPGFTKTLKPVEKVVDPDTRTEISETEVKNSFGFIDWIKTNFLLKFGVILVILAISGLVTYAFGNNWIGPMGQVILGILTGTVIIAVSNWLYPRNNLVGGALTVIGVVTNTLSAYVGNQTYSVLSSSIATILILGTLIFGVIVALKNNSKAVAIGVLSGGFLVPVLSKSDSINLTPLFAYLLCLNIVMFVLMYYKSWRVIQIIAMVGTFLYSLLLINSPQINNWYFLIPCMVIYVASSLLAIYKNQKFIMIDVVNTVIATLLTNLWLLLFIGEDWRVLVLMVSAVATFYFALRLRDNSVYKGYTYVQLISSLITIGLATFYQFYTISAVFTLLIAFEIVLFQYLLKKLFDSDRAFNVLPLLYILPFARGFEWVYGILTRYNPYPQGSEPVKLLPYLIQPISVAVILIVIFLVNIWLIDLISISKFAKKIMNPWIYLGIWVLIGLISFAGVVVLFTDYMVREFTTIATILTGLIILLSTLLYQITKTHLVKSRPNALTYASGVYYLIGLLVSCYSVLAFVNSNYSNYSGKASVGLMLVILVLGLLFINIDRLLPKFKNNLESNYNLVVRAVASLIIYGQINLLLQNQVELLLGINCLMLIETVYFNQKSVTNKLGNILNKAFLVLLYISIWLRLGVMSIYSNQNLFIFWTIFSLILSLFVYYSPKYKSQFCKTCSIIGIASSLIFSCFYVWNFGLLARIIMFFIMGAILISTGFVKSKSKSNKK